jgi:hypothetical protein
MELRADFIGTLQTKLRADIGAATDYLPRQ